MQRWPTHARSTLKYASFAISSQNTESEHLIEMKTTFLSHQCKKLQATLCESIHQFIH